MKTPQNLRFHDLTFIIFSKKASLRYHTSADEHLFFLRKATEQNTFDIHQIHH